MKVLAGEWFKLPFMGKDAFSRLMSARVEYDKAKGFRVTDDTDLARVAAVLAKELKEPFELASVCFVCSKMIDCEECDYGGVCKGGGYSRNCICNECYRGGDAYSIYTLRFAELSEAP